MEEVLNFAKLMAISDIAIPKHLRGNAGACLAICIQAVEWRMSPYAVASKSYVVNDRVAYESQLIHAVIEQRAPIAGRLRHEFSGDGGKRRCRVWAYAEGEKEPLEFTSPPFDSIQPKNSPLWKTKPDLQLYYNASRDWARAFFPDVIMGVYAEDELEVINEPRRAIAMPKPIAPRDILDATEPQEQDEAQAAVDDEAAIRKEFAECVWQMTEAAAVNEVAVLEARAKELAVDDAATQEATDAAEQARERIRSARGPRANGAKQDSKTSLLGDEPDDVAAAYYAEGN